MGIFQWNMDWLGRKVEPALEPDMAIIDPHHHLWRADELSLYPLSSLDYDVAALLADTTTAGNVAGTLFMECGWRYQDSPDPRFHSVGEVRAATEAIAANRANSGPPILGLVAFAELSLGDRVDDVLDAVESVAGERFKGVRRVVLPRGSDSTEHRSTEVMRQATFQQGLARLAARRRPYEVWCYRAQLNDVADLAARVPDATIVIDHFGGPIGIGDLNHREAIWNEWSQAVRCVSDRPNIVMKLGGLGMPVFGFGYEARAEPPSSGDLQRDWQDLCDFVITQFGPDRCMFESNFPVDKVSYSYRTIWNAFKRISARYSPQERHDLFVGTAARIYSLHPEATSGAGFSGFPT
jgi:L-fuconolactonase